jgi:GntR family transcriptional regulator
MSRYGVGMSTVTSPRERIVADLRAAILDGHYGPGDPLPSTHSLCGQYNTSRVTVRRALEKLNADGLIAMRQGAVPHVRTAPTVRIAIVADDWGRHRRARRPGFDATVAEHGIVGRQEILEVRGNVPAPGHIAAELHLEDSDTAVMRFVRMFADDQPVRLARSWFPTTWASGTPLAETRRIRGGAARVVEELRGPLATSYVDLEGRNATEEERTLLNLARGVQVVHTVTTFLDPQEQPVFVQEEIADASRHKWRFRVELR